MPWSFVILSTPTPVLFGQEASLYDDFSDRDSQIDPFCLWFGSPSRSRSAVAPCLGKLWLLEHMQFIVGGRLLGCPVCLWRFRHAVIGLRVVLPCAILLVTA